MATTHAVLDVPSISCMHCKMAIEGAAGAVPGVSSAVVDVAEKTVTVDFDPDVASLDDIEAAIGQEGYEVAGRRTTGA